MLMIKKIKNSNKNFRIFNFFNLENTEKSTFFELEKNKIKKI